MGATSRKSETAAAPTPVVQSDKWSLELNNNLVKPASFGFCLKTHETEHSPVSGFCSGLRACEKRGVARGQEDWGHCWLM